MILIILSSVADTTLSSEKKYFAEFWINFVSYCGIIKVKEKV